MLGVLILYKKLFVMLFFSIFILNDVFRIGFGEGSFFHFINVLLLIFGVLYFAWGVKKNRIRPIFLYFVISFCLLMLIQIPLTTTVGKVLNLGMISSTYLVPLLILTVKLSKDEASELLGSFLKYFNFFCVLLVIVGLLDYVTNASIQLFLANTYFQGTAVANYINGEHIWGVYRYYSLIGMPLTITKYYLLFYSLNHIYAKQEKFLMKPAVIMIVSLIGVLLSGSKTGIILILFLILFASHNKRFKFGFYLFVAVALWGFTLTPIYQNIVKERFEQGVQSGDLSTGRNQVVEALFNSNVESPGFFVGKGINYSREVVANLHVTNIFNFEYPILMMPYDYGILCTFIFYSLLFIFPIILLLKKRNFFILVHFLVMSLMVNNNNGLATIATDYTAQFVLVLVLLLNMGKQKSEKKIANKVALSKTA